MYANVYTYTHGKNDFVEISKNLDTDLKIILLNKIIIYLKYDEQCYKKF